MEKLSDRELVLRLVSLAGQERAVLGEVMRLLREVESRKLYVPMGFSSLYLFCVNELGYTEHETHIRIQATRLSKKVPEVEQFLEDGLISLTACSLAQAYFRRDEKKKAPVPVEKQKEIVKSICGMSKRQAEKKLAEYFPALPPREKVQMLSDGKVKVEFVVDEALWNKLQEIFSVRSHTNPAKRWDILIGDMAKLAWKKWSPYGRGKESPRPDDVDMRH